jgi:glycosyltransferase involved in cell wall biosynthesis
MAGANKVLESFAKIYPEADIYALFGERKSLSEELNNHNIYFSFLSKLPLIKYIYRYTFHLWPTAIEQMDLTEYDLVISSSSSVAHGVITPLGCKHIAYINSPMRYAWDLAPLYSRIVNFGFLKRTIKEVGVSFNRLWDVIAAQRPDVIVTNSKFVKKRVHKYWGRDVDRVIYPPTEKYEGEIITQRENYYVAGAPFEPNKRGDFLLECASKLGFNLKIIGTGSMRKKLKRKYRRYKNIEILDWISDEQKWKLISKARGFVVAGVEDYGMFCVEAISCGTPVLAYRAGGSLETVRENITGMFFDEWEISEFEGSLKFFEKKRWDYEKVRENIKNSNSNEDFMKKMSTV